jgi:hypothetical protein
VGELSILPFLFVYYGVKLVQTDIAVVRYVVLVLRGTRKLLSAQRDDTADLTTCLLYPSHIMTSVPFYALIRKQANNNIQDFIMLFHPAKTLSV